MKTFKLESFRAGQNPFTQDYISVGIDLGCLSEDLKGLYVMHAGKLGQGTYLVDIDTGDRIRIER